MGSPDLGYVKTVEIVYSAHAAVFSRVKYDGIRRRRYVAKPTFLDYSGALYSKGTLSSLRGVRQHPLDT